MDYWWKGWEYNISSITQFSWNFRLNIRKWAASFVTKMAALKVLEQYGENLISYGKEPINKSMMVAVEKVLVKWIDKKPNATSFDQPIPLLSSSIQKHAQRGFSHNYICLNSCFHETPYLQSVS